MFGGQTGSSLFGAPASSGGLFGATPASSGGLFGAPAASSGGLFGTPAASSGGLFGAPAASSGGLFGAPAASSGGLFGTPAAPTGGLFGASAASAGGLGGAAAASSGGLFGTPAASSGGLFGTPAASSGGLFGTPAPASGGLFGTPAPSSGGLFGTPAASSGGLFGAPATANTGLFGAPAASSGGLFGGAVQATTAVGAPATTANQVAAPTGHELAHCQSEQASIKHSLQEIQELCTPGSSNFKLTHLFLYVVDASQKVRPPDIPQAQWEAALQRAGGAQNHNGLWPVPVRGMQQLKAHHDAQQAALQDNRNYLAELRGLVQRISQWDESALQQRAHEITDRHSRLSLRLLKVIRMVDALTVRIASSADVRKMDKHLESISRSIADVEAQLAPNNVQGLKHRVDTVLAAVAMQEPQKGALSSATVDASSLNKAADLLAEHNKGIHTLQRHLDRIQRDITLIHNELNRQMVTFIVPASHARTT